jgi:hypothetical protein
MTPSATPESYTTLTDVILQSHKIGLLPLLAARLAAPCEQLLRCQAIATRDMAGPNAFLEALGDNRRRLSCVPTAPSPRASENLDPSRGSFSLRHVLTL